MTAYLASVSGGASGSLMLLGSSTLSTRIAKVEFYGDYAGMALTHFESPSVSGGSAVTPLPLRAGASVATTAAKTGSTVTGTATALTKVVVGSFANISNNTLPNYVYLTGNTAYTFPFDYILASGVALTASCTANSTFLIDIYFEELRLTGSL